MKFEWIGTSGFTPGVGKTVKGQKFDVPKDINQEFADQLEDEGKLKLIPKEKSK